MAAPVAPVIAPEVALVSLERVYHAIGLVVALVALMTLRDRSNPKHVTTGLFWSLFAATLLLDEPLQALVGVVVMQRLVGLAVVMMALVAGLGGIGHGRLTLSPLADRLRRAAALGNRLFAPALAISLVTIVCTLGLKGVSIAGVMLLDPQATLSGLALAALTALALACWLTRESPLVAVREARRLLDTIGWAALLPIMLAMLGGVFVAAGTGRSIETLTLLLAANHGRFLMVTLYCLGMAGFTLIMGNAFAAFPVMTAGIAVPILIGELGGRPAPIVALGMYAGYCGTLMTPMAANFNIVPAALLELKDRYGVIRAQAPTALILLGVNIVLMDWLAFR